MGTVRRGSRRKPYRNPRYARRRKMTAPTIPDPKDWDVTRKPAGVSQLYLGDNPDSQRALTLIARAGLPVHQVQTNGMPGPWPVLSTKHRTMVGLYQIIMFLRRLVAVSANGKAAPPGKE